MMRVLTGILLLPCAFLLPAILMEAWSPSTSSLYDAVLRALQIGDAFVWALRCLAGDTACGAALTVALFVCVALVAAFVPTRVPGDLTADVP